jgi:adenosylhomocysteine nucleosidase
MTIAIVAAMPEELAPLRARLSGPTRTQPTSLRSLVVERGRLGGHDVALATTGDGARNAREGVAALLAASGARALVVIGVSGALSPALATADLIVASRVTDEEGSVREADAESVAAATRATGGRAAVIVSARRIADSVDEKRRLAQQAGGGLAVVDLESASYVAAADGAGIPWIVLRAVSDTAGEALPPLLNRSLDAGGAVSRGRVLRGLLGDPGALPVLLTLRKRVAECALVLARAAEATLPACLAARGAA